MFHDRLDAGRTLGRVLAEEPVSDAPVVLGLPRGGVVVAAVVAERLRAQLDVIGVRKLGLPGHEQFAIGALGEDGVVVYDRETIDRVGLSQESLAIVEHGQHLALDRRLAALRPHREPVPISGRNVVIVDDGVATGQTARAAIAVARARGAAHVTFAAPVGSERAVGELEQIADRVVVPIVSAQFSAVSHWYDDFHEVTDDDVASLLDAVRSAHAVSSVRR